MHKKVCQDSTSGPVVNPEIQDSSMKKFAENLAIKCIWTEKRKTEQKHLFKSLIQQSAITKILKFLVIKGIS